MEKEEKGSGDFQVLDHMKKARMEFKQQKGEEAKLVPLDLLHPNRFQPRKTFNQKELTSLSSSIKEKGVLQPIIARRVSEADWQETLEIADGERRWRATKMAGLDCIPVLVRDYSDRDMKEIAFLCNEQPVRLSMVEKAAYLSFLNEEHGDCEVVAQRISMDKKSVERYVKAYKGISCCPEIEAMFYKQEREVSLSSALLFASIFDKVLLLRNGSGDNKSADKKGGKAGGKTVSKDTREFVRICAKMEKGINEAVPSLVVKFNGKPAKEEKKASPDPVAVVPPAEDMFKETDGELVLRISVKKESVTQDVMTTVHDNINTFMTKLNFLYSHPKGE